MLNHIKWQEFYFKLTEKVRLYHRHEWRCFTLTLGKKPSDLVTKEQKEKLAQDITDEINNIVNPPKKSKNGKVTPSEGPVKSTLFVNLIVQ